ncbi:(-)-alpha-terpineol synthase-like [Aristolochia californica]|uniref:(-)-alpha-terpineol synthase-like n=1 Tax=Aristolochia californica TaxID=171875 RepID=UPI0035D782C0
MGVPVTDVQGAQISSRPINHRRTANYKPSPWTYEFIQSLVNDYGEEAHERRVLVLKGNVIQLLNEATLPLNKLQLVDTLEHLGLEYVFEKEIKEALDSLSLQEDLHSIALYFKLLRRHGYEVSPANFFQICDIIDVFENYQKQIDGIDAKGLLSLYEASQLGFEAETIMEDIKEVAVRRLRETLDGNTDSIVVKQVKHALEVPLHRRLPLMEARWYLDIYEMEENMNALLLVQAQLLFNIGQAAYQRDVKIVSSWWKSLGVGVQLKFVRDRCMEVFLCSSGMIPEPRFDFGRKQLTKILKLIAVIDDLYDVYGELEELEIFTEAVQRWDASAVDQLPDFMKICFGAVLDTCNEIADSAFLRQGKQIGHFLAKGWSDISVAFLKEARWFHSGYIPSFEEYIENACISSSGALILIHAYVLLDLVIEEEELQFLQSYPDLIRGPSLIFRLCNDLATAKAEAERGDAPGCVECYMRETGESEEQARAYIESLIDKTWKTVTEETLARSTFPKPFNMIALNLCRAVQATYQDGDGYGAPGVRMKGLVTSILVKPIPI